MVLFTTGNKLRRFDTVNEIIETFCEKRLKLYKKRKASESDEDDGIDGDEGMADKELDPNRGAMGRGSSNSSSS